VTIYLLIPTAELFRDGKSCICLECSQSWTIWCNLNVHIKRDRTKGEKSIRCSECDNAFAYSSMIKSHWKIHSGDKPFVFLVCFQSYTRKDNRNGHMRIHTGEKPFKFAQTAAWPSTRTVIWRNMCDIKCIKCSKTFKKSSTLKRHLKLHTVGPAKNISEHVPIWIKFLAARSWCKLDIGPDTVQSDL
jgi:uncharacterized Zn-finger protein